MFKSSVVISAFSAALASVFMSLAFSKDPLWLHDVSLLSSSSISSLFGLTSLLEPSKLASELSSDLCFEILLRVIAFFLGVSSNVLMFRFFLTANVQAEAATEVNAAALGLNCVFAVLISRVAGLVGLMVRKMRSSDHSSFGDSLSSDVLFDYLKNDSLFGKGENVGNFICGVGLILLGVGLLGGGGNGNGGSSVGGEKKRPFKSGNTSETGSHFEGKKTQ